MSGKRIAFVEKTIGQLIEQYNKCNAELLKIQIEYYKKELRVLYGKRKVRQAKNRLNQVSNRK